MEQYIPKSALVAEIKRLLAFYSKEIEDNKEDPWSMDIAKMDILQEILSFLDTLEVKEVDLDSDIRTYLTNHFNIYENGVLQSKKSGLPLRAYDIIKVAKHFFALGMAVSNKSQKGE